MIRSYQDKRRLTQPFDTLFSRRALLRGSAAFGGAIALPATSLSARAASTEAESLVISTDSWIRDQNPSFADIDSEFAVTLPVTADADFNFDVMVADAKREKSAWDAYIGVTPFFDLLQYIESGAIEPWDPYLPDGYLEDLPAAVRDEGSYDGKFYIWPVLLDVVVQNWNGVLLEKAGFDPKQLPTDWDTYLSMAASVQSKGVATYGCSYDVTPWRSLIPIALSLGADVFNADGTFAWTSEPAVEALEIMRRMTELSRPGAGSADTFMDPGPFFALEEEAALLTYSSAAVFQTATWSDPRALAIAGPPTTPKRGGGSVFWDTGAVLFKYGGHKEEAASYLHALTRDQRVWQHALAGDAGVPGTATGHLPSSSSIWNGYKTDPPVWLADAPWALPAWDAMETASFVQPTTLGFDQFIIALPFYSAYLTGEEADPKIALQRAQDAVAAEAQK